MSLAHSCRSTAAGAACSMATRRPCLEAIAREGTFRPRAECETDPSWKQVIPYLVLRDRGRLFLMRRTRAGSDQRLHERYTIGIGGHVNPEDGGLAGGLRAGVGGGDRGRLGHPTSGRSACSTTTATRSAPSTSGSSTSPRPAVGRSPVRETHKLEGAFVAPARCAARLRPARDLERLLYDFLTARAAACPSRPHESSPKRPR